MKNFYLGDNELVIINFNSTHTHCQVIEKYEDWQRVFWGTEEECNKYCKNREIEYEESIIG